jgi:uncharacterized phage protein (predicted DNA packaging)
MELQEMKEYLRIDGGEDDFLISSLILGAEQFLMGTGVPGTSKTLELYAVALKMLVTHWYENREPFGKAEELAFTLSNIITQLKYCSYAEEV